MVNPNQSSSPSQEILGSRVDWLFFKELCHAVHGQPRKLVIIAGSFAIWYALKTNSTTIANPIFEPDCMEIYVCDLTLQDILKCCGSFAGLHGETLPLSVLHIADGKVENIVKTIDIKIQQLNTVDSSLPVTSYLKIHMVHLSNPSRHPKALAQQLATYCDISVCKVALFDPHNPQLYYPHESIRQDIMRREFTYVLPDSVSRKKLHRHINKYISRGFSLKGFALPTETIAVDYIRAGQPLHPTYAKLARCFGIPPCTYCERYRPNESRIDIFNCNCVTLSLKLAGDRRPELTCYLLTSLRDHSINYIGTTTKKLSDQLAHHNTGKSHLERKHPNQGPWICTVMVTGFGSDSRLMNKFCKLWSKEKELGTKNLRQKMSFHVLAEIGRVISEFSHFRAAPITVTRRYSFPQTDA